MGRALHRLAGLAIRRFHYESLHRAGLALQRLSRFLDLEDSAWEGGAAGGAKGSAPVDSNNEPRKPYLGAPRIYGELLKLGIEIGETSVSKYMVRRRKPPSQTWRTFLKDHVKIWCRSTSSPCRRSGSRSCTCFWCWRMIAGGCAFCGDGSPARRMDRSTNARGLSLGYRAAISAARSNNSRTFRNVLECYAKVSRHTHALRTTFFNRNAGKSHIWNNLTTRTPGACQGCSILLLSSPLLHNQLEQALAG